MKKKASLKDIAEKVGVSTALVSYVLNGKMKGRINKDVAARIKQVAKELDYRPNQIAKSLKTNKTYTIGLILADIANPFFSQIARIIENEAKELNYTVLIGSSDESIEKAKELIQLFLNRQVDGLILSLPENSDGIVYDLKRKEIPFVLLDRYFPDVVCNSVAVDNYNASSIAIEHLLNQGVTRVGLINYETSLHHLNERTRGATDLLTGKTMIGKVRLGYIDKDVKNAIDSFLNQEEPVEAIFFLSNLLTITGLKYINQLKIRVPDQVAVIAFDKTEAFELFYTSISYINQPISDLGKNAVSLMHKAIENVGHSENIFLPTNLVINNSSIYK